MLLNNTFKLIYSNYIRITYILVSPSIPKVVTIIDNIVTSYLGGIILTYYFSLLTIVVNI